MAIVNKREAAVEYEGQTKEAQESVKGRRAWWEDRHEILVAGLTAYDRFPQKILKIPETALFVSQFYAPGPNVGRMSWWLAQVEPCRGIGCFVEGLVQYGWGWHALGEG